MIIESHLRMGNLVEYLGDIIEVYQIFRNGIHDEKFNGFPYEDINPIPLTEEWLSKLEHIRESEFYDGNHNKGFYLGENESMTVVCFEDGIYLYTMEDGEGWGYVGKKIEFVHELQNIFYWNNNEKVELTLKQ